MAHGSGSVMCVFGVVFVVVCVDECVCVCVRMFR